LGKRARSVGVSGVDPMLDQADRLSTWLQPLRDRQSFSLDVQRLEQFGAIVFLPSQPVPDERKTQARASILASLEREHFLGREILRFGAIAAQRQAERLFQLRGVRASVTSIDEASSAAVHGILSYDHDVDGARVCIQRRFDKVSRERWQHPVFVRAVRKWAARAAFKSFSSWASVGTTGDNTHNAAQFAGRAFVDEFTTALADQLSLASWRRDDPVWFDSQQTAR
jgi:hypothetical protein